MKGKYHTRHCKIFFSWCQVSPGKRKGRNASKKGFIHFLNPLVWAYFLFLQAELHLITRRILISYFKMCSCNCPAWYMCMLQFMKMNNCKQSTALKHVSEKIYKNITQYMKIFCKNYCQSQGETQSHNSYWKQ